MDWQNDPELEKLFKDELDDRSGSLVDGAKAMLRGDISSELAGRMLREGHTIKGTGRVMGYEGIARGGEACEFVWRFIQQGELEPSSMLGRTLLMLAESIPGALTGEDTAVSESIDTLRTLIDNPSLLALLPEPLTDTETPTPSASTPADVSPTTEVHIESAEDAPETATEGTADVATPEPAAEAAAAADLPESVPEPETEIPAPEPVAEVASAEPAASPAPDVEPLVFEPGPDGKLATPMITYEVVAASTQPDAAAGIETALPAAPTSPAVGVPLEEPPSLKVVEGSQSVLDPETNKAYDLGGLVGAVEKWATEESVPVNAGRLFRMINNVAAMRIDIDSAVKQASDVLSSGSKGASAAAVEEVRESLEAVRRASLQLESAALGLTVMPISNITSTLPQLVKYVSKKLDRDVVLVVEGDDTLIDRQLLDRIGEVIRQLVVNAVTHGLEPADVRVAAGKSSVGTVRVSASRDDQHLQIAVSDDGAGIDWTAVREMAIESELVGDDPTADDLRSVLYTDAFSTNPDSSEFTGSGSGLGRVKDIVEEVYGSMTLDSSAGLGTSFVITMPTHRALQRAQLFTAGGRMWGIPDSVVVEIAPMPDVSISVTEKGSSIGFEDESVPYSSFASAAGLDLEGLPSQVMVLRSPTGMIALAVDEVLDTHEVATKDLGPLLSGSSVVSGVALLGGDETVMLVDAGRLADRMRSAGVLSEGPVHTVLVVDDSQGVRQVVSGVLASHGFSTVSAGSVSDALAALARNDVDALVVDFSMPRADGVALVHMVRHRYGVIPIVMLSGVASEEDRLRAERAGVDAFFDKADFAKGALVQTLRDLIEKDEANGESDSEDSVIAS
jgi:chemotaxis protein histidine kinase CheA/ActR/RegA family two-component response regulator